MFAELLNDKVMLPTSTSLQVVNTTNKWMILGRQIARLFSLWTESLFQTGDQHFQELCVQLRSINNYHALNNHLSIIE